MKIRSIAIFFLGMFIGIGIVCAFLQIQSKTSSGNQYPMELAFKTKTGRIWRVTYGGGLCEITFTDNVKMQFYGGWEIMNANLQEGYIYTIYFTGSSEPYTFEKAIEVSE